MNRELTNRMIGAILMLTTSLLTFLVTAYFSSFASRAEVNEIEYKIDKIMTGLCIIDVRTCILKETRNVR